MLRNAAIAVLAAGSATTAIAADPPPASQWPCQFVGNIVVGCSSAIPDNMTLAAELFQSYGLNSKELDQPYTKEIVARSGCRVVRNDRGTAWQIYARGPKMVPTLKGYEPVLLVELPQVGQFFFISGHYVHGQCPLPPAPTVHVVDPSHPYGR